LVLLNIFYTFVFQMKKVLLIFALGWMNICIAAEAKDMPVPYTLGDRERIVNLELTMKSESEKSDLKFQNIDKQFQNINDQFDVMRTDMRWIFGIIFGMIISFFGYLLWDRKSSLTPIENKIETNKTKLDSLVNALKELAKSDPNVAQVLRAHSLL
jgi:hypothetical protein